MQSRAFPNILQVCLCVHWIYSRKGNVFLPSIKEAHEQMGLNTKLHTRASRELLEENVTQTGYAWRWHSITGITNSCPKTPGDPQTQDSCISLQKEADLTWSCKESDLMFTCFSCSQMRPAVWKHGHIWYSFCSHRMETSSLRDKLKVSDHAWNNYQTFFYLSSAWVFPSPAAHPPLLWDAIAGLQAGSGMSQSSSITAKAGRNIQTPATAPKAAMISVFKKIMWPHVQEQI